MACRQIEPDEIIFLISLLLHWKQEERSRQQKNKVRLELYANPWIGFLDKADFERLTKDLVQAWNGLRGRVLFLGWIDGQTH